MNDFQRNYEKWWLGKRVRLIETGEFRTVVKVEFFGPPSGVYGSVRLTFEDGSYDFVTPRERMAFRPRKKDVEIEE